MHRVMIVDDHEFILESLKYGLEEDYEVTTVTSGDECLATVESVSPDVVMIDYKMKGLNGLEVAEKLGRISNPPAVIMMSACMDRDLKKQATAKGVFYCMTKPFDLDELKQKLYQAVLSRNKATIPVGANASKK